MYEELASFREVVNFSPPQALDEAESFFVGQGYVVVHRTATTLTFEREATEGTAAQEEAPKLVVMAVPEPHWGGEDKGEGQRPRRHEGVASPVERVGGRSAQEIATAQGANEGRQDGRVRSGFIALLSNHRHLGRVTPCAPCGRRAGGAGDLDDLTTLTSWQTKG